MISKMLWIINYVGKERMDTSCYKDSMTGLIQKDVKELKELMSTCEGE